MYLHNESISHLFQPNYIGDSKYRKYVDKAIKFDKCSFKGKLSICKSDLNPWRVKPYDKRLKLDETRSFEMKQIIRRYNNDFKDRLTHSNANNPNYIKTLNDLLSMKDQSLYLPQRLKMFNDNKASSTIQLHNKGTKGSSMSMSPSIRSKTMKGSFFITGYEGLNKANKQHCVKLKPLSNQFQYLTTHVTQKSGIDSTKAYRKLFTEETKEKDMKRQKQSDQLEKSEETNDILMKAPNEYPKEREIENELNKQFQFLTNKTNTNSTSNKNIQAIVNRIKKLNDITISDKERNKYLMQSNKDYLSSQNNFFKVLYMRMKKEQNNNKPQDNTG